MKRLKKLRRPKKFSPLAALVLCSILAFSWLYIDYANDNNDEAAVGTVLGEGFYCKRLIVLFGETASQAEIDSVINGLGAKIAFHLDDSNMYDLEIPGECDAGFLLKSMEAIKQIPGVESVLKSYPINE